MTDLIGREHGLTTACETTLAALAGTMIPASGEHGVPGADDPDILADILAAAAGFAAFLEEAMSELNGSVEGGNFAALDADLRLSAAERFRVSHAEAMGLVISVVAQCYYRDERVMTALGMAPRPPFPDGHELPEGDWTLLDPVRSRGPLYREA
jgi:hypothetical protein